MGVPNVDIMLGSLLVALVALTSCSGASVDLAALLRNTQHHQRLQHHQEPLMDDKRSSGEHLGENNDGESSTFPSPPPPHAR